MPKRDPVLPLEAGTTMVSLITWNSANKSQNSASKDEEVTFVRYWERGNPWIFTRRQNGLEGLLRTEFLSPILEGEALRKALDGARSKLPGIVQQLRDEPLSNDVVADNLVEAPQLPQLAEEMIRAGALEVLCERVGDRTQTLKQLHWALGGETGVLANICNFSNEAMQRIADLNLIPIIARRAEGLLTGEAEVGVNSVAARSVQLLAKFAHSERFHRHVCNKHTVKLVLDVFGNKSNGIHKWNTRSHEKTWSVYLVFAWAGEFIAGLALHDDGRKMLTGCKAVSILSNVTSDVEGATAKDYIDGTLALLVNRERPKKKVSRGITFKKKSTTNMVSRGGHVMISYSWATQPMALAIKDELERNEYRVWIDREKMEGNVMVRMAEAVEGADAVIILLSERYARSRNCNLEAAYIKKLETYFVAVMADRDADNLPGDAGNMLHQMIANTKAAVVDMRTQKVHSSGVADIIKALADRGKGTAATATKAAKAVKKKEPPAVVKRLKALEAAWEKERFADRIRDLTARVARLEQK